MFHVNNGLYFERVGDGSVRVVKKESATENAPIIFEYTLDANDWASVISSMSVDGEENGGFYYGLNFHRGDPIPDAYKWRFRQPTHCGYDPEKHSKLNSDENPFTRAKFGGFSFKEPEMPPSDPKPCELGHENPSIRQKAE